MIRILPALIATSLLLVAAPVAMAVGNTDNKIGICHATGSASNPYVFITVDKHAVPAHSSHQDGRDVIGARSLADCPKPAVLAAATTSLPATGRSVGALIGVPAMALAGRAYLRSRRAYRVA